MVRIKIAIVTLTWVAASGQPAAQEKQDSIEVRQQDAVVLHVEGMT